MGSAGRRLQSSFMRRIIIELPAHQGSQDYRYTGGQDGLRATVHGQCAPSALPRALRGETRVVIPGSRLSWHAARLPRGLNERSPRLHAVLAGLLEEELLQDPEHLHLALGPARADGQGHWVAVCERDWLQAQLQSLESAGTPIDGIAPESVPETDRYRLRLSGQAEQAWLTASGPDIGVLRLPATADALALVRAQMRAGLDPLLESEPAVAQLAQNLFGTDHEIVLITPAEALWQSGNLPCDLAQAEFARSGRQWWLGRLRQLWGQMRHAPAWRPARWGLLGLLLAQALGIAAWTHHTRKALDKQRSLVQQIALQTFPDLPRSADVPRQMATELARLQREVGQASAEDFGVMGSLMDELLPTTQQPRSMEFSLGRLTVQTVQLSANELSSAQALASRHGYRLMLDGEQLQLSWPARD